MHAWRLQRVAAEALAVAMAGGVHSAVVPDQAAVDALCRFAGWAVSVYACKTLTHRYYHHPCLDDHRFLVEPACAAALSAVYNPAILDGLEAAAHVRARAAAPGSGGIVVVVCGGSGVSLDLIASWRARVGL